MMMKWTIIAAAAVAEVEVSQSQRRAVMFGGLWIVGDVEEIEDEEVNDAVSDCDADQRDGISKIRADQRDGFGRTRAGRRDGSSKIRADQRDGSSKIRVD